MPYTCKTPGCQVTAATTLTLSKHKCKGRVAAIAALAEQRQLEADNYARKRARLNEVGDYARADHCVYSRILFGCVRADTHISRP